MTTDDGKHAPKPLAFNFMTALYVAEQVFVTYKADQLRWWKRMDGTPILNDVACRMAEAFCEYAKTGIESHAQHMKKFLEELAPYLGVDHGEFKPLDLIEAAAKIREACNSHATLLRERDELRRALDKYGVHLFECPVWRMPGDRCSCGLAEVIKP